MNERRRFIRRVEMLHALAALAAVGLALMVWPGERWTGVLAGVLLGAANFRAMAMFTERLTGSVNADGRNRALALLVGKLMALIVIVGVVMLILKPDPLAFILGISLAPAALLLVAAVARPGGASDLPDQGAGPNAGEVP
jgi:hypothetical protein